MLERQNQNMGVGGECPILKEGKMCWKYAFKFQWQIESHQFGCQAFPSHYITFVVFL